MGAPPKKVVRSDSPVASQVAVGPVIRTAGLAAAASATPMVKEDSAAQQAQTSSAAVPCDALLASGHTLRPELLGQRVVVIGDGWGGRIGTGTTGKGGGYEAVVTEADERTLTVIPVSGEGAWRETHVLKEFCIPVVESTSSAAPAQARKAKKAVKSERRRS